MARLKKSNKPKQPDSHEARVFQLGSKLLSTLEKNRLPRNDENIKGISWFLICVGESLEKGSLYQARQMFRNKREIDTTTSLGTAFCLKGCEISDWATALYHRNKDKTNVPSDDN